MREKSNWEDEQHLEERIRLIAIPKQNVIVLVFAI